MDHEDQISQFFPGQESVNLYVVLNLDDSSNIEDIKKSYRRLALLYHPDKHTKSLEEVRADASAKFQQIGFAYSVLSDEKRRAIYDRTGRTDEALVLQPGEGGWDAYFTELFDCVTKGKLDEMKREYQGSAEEVEDIKGAYIETGGCIEEMMNHIPHSTHDDEARFIVLVTQLIEQSVLPSLQTWEIGVKDEKAKLVRKKQNEKEAKEAEELAKELGVWDEFYGSGKLGPRRGKGAGKSKKDENAEDDHHTTLQALILGRKKKAEGFFDSLAAKYADQSAMGPKSRKGRKRKGGDGANDGVEGVGEHVKESLLTPPDIDDEEFARLQQKLFGDKEDVDATTDLPGNVSTATGIKNKRRKAK